MQRVDVRGAPSGYYYRERVLEELPQLIEKQNWNNVGVIHGKKSWHALEEFWPPMERDLTFEMYNGECSREEVRSMVDRFDDREVIIGAGGGKVLDLAKACAHELGLPVILIPTLASNCAPWTPLSVFYDSEGNFSEYEIFPLSSFAVMVEPAVLLKAPIAYLRAGIGDTLAKWYEADVLMRNLDSLSIPLDVARQTARLCKDVLIEEGEEAIDAASHQEMTSAFKRVTETIILAGGMVGGFGDKYGRVSGAHSVHNGLTMIPETHKYLHGDKVAYGILVQLSIEGRLEEIKKLLPFYRRLHLPVSLSDIGVKQGEAVIKKLSERIVMPGETIRLMQVTKAQEVKQAIEQLETLVS